MHALALALLLVAGAGGSYDASMKKAVGLYNEAEWDAALRELTIAEKFATTDAQRLSVWLHEGIMMANVPDADAARAAWKRALELDVKAELPLPVSPRVKALFQEVQKQVKQQLADAPRKQTLTPRRPQALDEQRFPIVPVISLGLGLVSGGIGLAFAVVANSTRDASRAPGADMAALSARASLYSTIANIAFAVAGAAALTALITFILLD